VSVPSAPPQSEPSQSGGLVFVLSGPSGVGKDSLKARLREMNPSLHHCVTATTRTPRPGEQNGVDYYFYSRTDFERLRDAGGLLEWDEHFGQLYGAPCGPVLDAIEQGRDVLAEVDVNGAMSIRKRIPNAVLIFLAPASLAELQQRLRARGTEDEAALALRLSNAEREMGYIPNFDYVVVNHEGDLGRAVSDVHGIMRSERLRASPRYAAVEGNCAR
jgi:guanylate kinase